MQILIFWGTDSGPKMYCKEMGCEKFIKVYKAYKAYKAHMAYKAYKPYEA